VCGGGGGATISKANTRHFTHVRRSRGDMMDSVVENELMACTSERAPSNMATSP